MKLELEQGAKYGYKWWSVRFMALALGAEFLQTLVPVWNDYLPPHVSASITATLVTLALVSRFIHQEIPKDD